MNSQKTGQLIAQQRGALGLTQKQLASQLHISDRTVSRWERGVGFPDLSLLEPLADALGLSVIELLRGEHLPPEQQPTPQTEHTARDVLNSAGEMVRKTARRFRWLLTALAALVVLAGAVCLLAGGPRHPGLCAGNDHRSPGRRHLSRLPHHHRGI